jgi:hypothetical protein
VRYDFQLWSFQLPNGKYTVPPRHSDIRAAAAAAAAVECHPAPLQLHYCYRFGVRQRERLLQGLSVPPHMLLMSATPIPRTLALVQYGGLVLSTIATMPPGRSRVATQVVVDSDAAREQVSNLLIWSFVI